MAADWRKEAGIEAAPASDWRTEAGIAPVATETSLHPPPRAPRLPDDANVVQGRQSDPVMTANPAMDAALQGLGKGVSGGFIDEAGGVAEAGGHLLRKARDFIAPTPIEELDATELAKEEPRHKSLGEAYRSGRDNYRGLQAAIEGRDAGGIAGPVADIAGAMLVPVPGPGKATGIAKAAKTIGTAAGLGGLFGLGNSKADVTRGEGGQALLDAGKSAGISAGLAGGLMGVGKLVSAARGGAASRAATATEEALAKGAADKEKAVNSARGAWGSRTQEANRSIENAEQLVKYGNPAEQQKAIDWLASPEVAELRRGILNNSVERGQTAQGLIDKARGEFDTALAQDSTTLAREGLGGTFKRAVLPRVKTLASRGVPLAIGSQIGGWPGLVAGGVASAMMGKPGTILANFVKDPNVRRHGWNAVQAVLAGTQSVGAPVGQHLGKFAPVIAQAIKQYGPDGGQAMHQALLETDEGYAKDVAAQVAQVQP